MMPSTRQGPNERKSGVLGSEGLLAVRPSPLYPGPPPNAAHTHTHRYAHTDTHEDTAGARLRSTPVIFGSASSILSTPNHSQES